MKRGTYAGCTVEFLCYAESKISGAKWLEVYGGRRGQQSWVVCLPLDAV